MAVCVQNTCQTTCIVFSPYKTPSQAHPQVFVSMGTSSDTHEHDSAMAHPSLGLQADILPSSMFVAVRFCTIYIASRKCLSTCVVCDPNVCSTRSGSGPTTTWKTALYDTSRAKSNAINQPERCFTHLAATIFNLNERILLVHARQATCLRPL